MEQMNKLVERVRRLTHAQKFTDSATIASQRGMQTQTLVDMFTEGQRSLHGVLYDTGSSAFIKTTTIPTLVNIATYTVPSDAFLGLNIISVEYKWGDADGEYRKLDQESIHERRSDVEGEPYTYVQINNSIILQPIPTEAKADGLRITYEFEQTTLDIRRGKVTVVDDANNPTSITVDENTQLSIALTNNVVGTYITLVDKDGIVQMKDIPVASYASGTGVITLGTFTSETSEVVEIGDYVVIGRNASTHSPFPNFCEPYLTAYVRHEILDLIAHPSVGTAATRLVVAQNTLSTIWANWQNDAMLVPEIDVDRYI